MAVAGDKEKLLYKVAKAYYEDELTQGQIGKRLGLSRIKVSRLLQQARDERIVQITIVPPQDSNADLERRLETRFGLNEAVIVSPTAYDAQTIGQELGLAAADCVIRCLQGHETLALSWGTTLRAVVDALPVQNWPNLKVVQILGGLGQPEAETHGTDIIWRTAQAFGARPRLLPAPGIVTSQYVRDALLKDPQMSDTLALAARADVALVGIGRPTPGSVVLQAGILTEEELNRLHAQGAVGDIALRFFDAAGRAIDYEINDRIIGLTLAQVKKIPRVIGVAAGKEKFEVIRAALAGQLIDVLVVDDQVARMLLAETEESKPAKTDVTLPIA